MKGIILAGGSGTRLYPITKATSKQLLPLYDKPMIYYPLTTLMSMDIKEILIITTRDDQENFQKLLGDGTDLGIHLEYTIQDHPNGIGEAFILGQTFIGDEDVTLILGDNFFYGQHLEHQLIAAKSNVESVGGANVFGVQVADASSYGVVEFNEKNDVVSIVEKPSEPASNYAIPGIYVFDSNVCKHAETITKSSRGELEIVDILNIYLNNGKLKVELFELGLAWLDTGTHSDLLEAANFVRTIQERQGILIGSPEQCAFQKGFITCEMLLSSITNLQKNEYGRKLKKLCEVTNA